MSDENSRNLWAVGTPPEPSWGAHSALPDRLASREGIAAPSPRTPALGLRLAPNEKSWARPCMVWHVFSSDTSVRATLGSLQRSHRPPSWDCCPLPKNPTPVLPSALPPVKNPGFPLDHRMRVTGAEAQSRASHEDDVDQGEGHRHQASSVDGGGGPDQHHSDRRRRHSQRPTGTAARREHRPQGGTRRSTYASTPDRCLRTPLPPDRPLSNVLRRRDNDLELSRCSLNSYKRLFVVNCLFKFIDM